MLNDTIFPPRVLFLLIKGPSDLKWWLLPTESKVLPMLLLRLLVDNSRILNHKLVNLFLQEI